MSERYECAKDLFEERAAIREYYAGYPRAEAERLARLEVAEWLNAHSAEKVES